MKPKIIGYTCLGLAAGIATYTMFQNEESPRRSISTPTPVGQRAQKTAPLQESPDLLRKRELANAATEGGIKYTMAWDGIWLMKYPGVDPSKPNIDSDGDGRNNRDEMLAGTDPFNGKGSAEPNRQETGMLSATAGGPTYEQTRRQLSEDATRLH